MSADAHLSPGAGFEDSMTGEVALNMAHFVSRRETWVPR